MPAAVAALVTARSTRDALMRRPRSVNKNSERRQLGRPESHWSRRVLSCGYWDQRHLPNYAPSLSLSPIVGVHLQPRWSASFMLVA